MAGKYEVDYNDSRLVSVKNEQAQKESEIKNRYDTLANESKIYYDKQIENSKNFLQCGFWKVYDNEKAVLHLFHCYAACIRRVYDSLQEGASLQSMICSAA